MNQNEWDDEFWRIAGQKPPKDEPFDELGEVPNLMIIDLEKIDAYKEYLEILKAQQKIKFFEHQVVANNIQSKTFLQAMTGLAVLTGIALSIGWTVWYWVN